MTIWAHTLIKNEERYIWFSIMSVIDFVDKILVWDTGSIDQTPKIIKAIKNKYPDKIVFEEVGPVDIESFTKMRQDMLKRTKADWLLVLDGDEVWWENSIKNALFEIGRDDSLETIVTPYFNIVGDIYHYQDERLSGYKIDERAGFFNIRIVSMRIPGLEILKPHGQQGFFDNKGVLIQNRPKKFRKFINSKYMHFTNVLRSSSHEYDLKVPKRNIKLKYDIGLAFPKDFYYPEVFFRPRPDIIPSPWYNMSDTFRLKSYLIRPLRFIKKSILPSKSGY